MSNQQSQAFRIALVVSLGGFLFGFDASVISGVIGFVAPQFQLTELQQGWVVSSPSFAAMFAMFVIGKLSDRYGRKALLLVAAALYTISAVLSAIATGYVMLVVARMIGGVGFGAALVLAPMYIGEVSPTHMRGKLVSVQQLNIVLGFSVSYFSNYLLLNQLDSSSFFTELTIWRWMLGIETLPAIIYFFSLFTVPRSPRWLALVGRHAESKKVLSSIYDEKTADHELDQIEEHIRLSNAQSSNGIQLLLTKPFKLILILGLTLAIVQQVTGINSILFYATTIFEQSGIGKNASFAQTVWVGLTQVAFTIITMYSIDRWGRKPLMITGLSGIAVSMAFVAFGFYQATYELKSAELETAGLTAYHEQLSPVLDQQFSSDLAFNNALREQLGEQNYLNLKSQILSVSVTMNAKLVLFGILLFMAAFSLSVGPVMWVLFSEIFPTTSKGALISIFGFINALTSFLVQLVFPWELANLGNAASYLLFGVFAIFGVLILVRYLPETKGKSLEELEEILIK